MKKIEVNLDKIIYILTMSGLPYFNIYRDFYKKVTDIDTLPAPTVDYDTDIDRTKFDTMAYTDAVNTFIDTLEANFNKDDLKYFYLNIKTLQIGGNDKYRKLSLKRGSFYHGFENYIEINKNKPYHIFHELFHMATTNNLKDFNYTGFHRVLGKHNDISRGLNEGYNELMTQRYFGDYDGFGDSKMPKKHSGYKYEVKVSSIIETIVGKDKMEKLFLNASLKGLVRELNKYISEDEIYEFISKLDFIHDYYKSKEKRLFKISMLKEAIDVVNRFLYKIYANYLITLDNVNIRNELYGLAANLDIINPIKKNKKFLMIEMDDAIYIESLIQDLVENPKIYC